MNIDQRPERVEGRENKEELKRTVPRYNQIGLSCHIMHTIQYFIVYCKRLEDKSWKVPA